jgi:hypothetical protein
LLVEESVQVTDQDAAVALPRMLLPGDVVLGRGPPRVVV